MMTVNYNEQLSALVDGELQGEQLEYVLALLKTDVQAQKQFQRYQHTSDVLHGFATKPHPIDLSESLALALKDEPMHAMRSQPKAKVLPFPSQLWKQISGLAIAASVGALAVVGVMTQPDNQLISTSVQTVANATSNDLQPQRASSNRWTVGEPEVEERLNTYLVDHNEYAGASGVFSYARVVSYDARQ
ncbi:MAG: sigma-E factor negative regulatory protein [Gammaproteobacteria bacterium]|nr:sigma-E factor negative regulatory protein [Gammaproteobacteria bacterium]